MAALYHNKWGQISRCPIDNYYVVMDGEYHTIEGGQCISIDDLKCINESDIDLYAFATINEAVDFCHQSDIDCFYEIDPVNTNEPVRIWKIDENEYNEELFVLKARQWLDVLHEYEQTAH